MNILLIGSGGREHAIAWKLAQSPTLDHLWAAPGNPGIAAHAACVALDTGDHAAVLGFAQSHAIDLVVIGPEGPLVDGLADSLRAGGVAVFGPGKAAAQLEGSKGFTKDLCTRHGIPTAAFVRHRDLANALRDVGSFGYPVVIKADGLAAGKGVVIAEDEFTARAALGEMFGGGFGGAGAEVVIEAFLTGEEVSLFALTDGATAIAFATAQDHKRVGDGDTGPNTGGMGAYSPATVLTPQLEAQAMREIVLPTVAAMRDAGTPFVGVLYAGLMLTADGPKLIEYNARFGDPEAQVILPRFTGDFAALLHAVAIGDIGRAEPPVFSDYAALTVVLAAAGYPGHPESGQPIAGLEDAAADGAIVFQAGTRGDPLVSSGGRVLAVTASGGSISDARARAYAAIAAIDMPGGFYRRDIGWREIARSPVERAVAAP